MYNDKKRAVLWAKEHWHVAGFICACLPVVGAVLVDLGVLTVRAAVVATLAAVVYVLMTTWSSTHGDDEDGHTDQSIGKSSNK